MTSSVPGTSHGLLTVSGEPPFQWQGWPLAFQFSVFPVEIQCWTGGFDSGLALVLSPLVMSTSTWHCTYVTAPSSSHFWIGQCSMVTWAADPLSYTSFTVKWVWCYIAVFCGVPENEEPWCALKQGICLRPCKQQAAKPAIGTLISVK